MFFVVQRRHDGGDHFALETSKSPCLRSDLHDALHGDLDAFLLFWISKVSDSVDDLLDNGSGSSIDALLRASAGKSSKECLLSPNRFFARALLANVVAHRGEKRVGFVVAASKTEQEWAKDTESNELRYSVGDVCGSDLSGGNAITKEGR